MGTAAKVSRALTVVALAAGVAACGSNSGSGGSGGSGNSSSTKDGVTADSIKYGLIYDQTGAQNVAQEPWAHGVLTQLKKANDAGGINGRKIDVVSADDKSAVPLGIQAMKKFISQTPTLGITGINGSSIQEAAMPTIRKEKMPYVGPQSTTKAGLVPFNDSAFYVIPSYADQVDVYMKYMTDRLKTPKPKVAVFRLIASSGVEVDDLTKAVTKKMGGQIVADQELDPTATTADAQIQKIVAAKPDFIVFHTSPTLSVLGLKAMQKLGAKIPVISTFAGGGPVPYAAVPKAIGDLFQYTSAFTPSDVAVPGTTDLVADAKKYGYAKDAANSQYVIGYVVGKVVVEGIKRAGKDLTRESFVKALAGIKDLDTGELSPPVTYGPQDRSGISESRPYEFDYATKKFKAIGSYEDYAGAITNAYSAAR
jgi:branched-chain amino acid transport system substrate-binding protein